MCVVWSWFVLASPVLTQRFRFHQHESTLRLFHAWLQEYELSQTDELVKQDLVAIESDNYCCGFGPPVQCTGRVRFVCRISPCRLFHMLGCRL